MPGIYTYSIYQDDEHSNYYRVKVQPETLSLVINSKQNTGSSGNAFDYPPMKITGSRRKITSTPRKVILKWVAATPSGYSSTGTIILPWLDAFGFTQFAVGSQGEYFGLPVEVKLKLSEQIR